MTTAIHQEPRFHKMLLALGLVLVVGIGIATQFRGEPDAAGGDRAATPPARAEATVSGDQFRAIQDGYLPPRAILAEQAKVDAYLSLQDGYVPPSVAASSNRQAEAFLAIQDGYLPPADWVDGSEPRGGSIRLGANEPQ
ncbi:MAG: hypothetical protein WEE53_00985 [Acidimicrobiia bacterium]